MDCDNFCSFATSSILVPTSGPSNHCISTGLCVNSHTFFDIAGPQNSSILAAVIV